MSDPNVNQPGTAEAPDQRDADAEALGEAGKKALAAERDARKAAEKAVADLTAQLATVEAHHTAALKAAQDATEQAQQAAATATTDALRWKTVAAHKIDVEDAEVFITGADEDSITRQAERLAGLATKTEPGPTTPKPDATQGATGEPAQTTTAHQFAAAVESAFN